MRQELYKWYDKKYPDTGAVFHFDIVLKWQVETTALNSDFLNENGPILSMIIIGLNYITCWIYFQLLQEKLS